MTLDLRSNKSFTAHSAVNEALDRRIEPCQTRTLRQAAEQEEAW
jgi:hypothetical protein